MNNINKVLLTTEKNYKITDPNGNEIGEIKETYHHASGNYSYCAMKMFSYGNYRILGIYGTEKTALKHLFGRISDQNRVISHFQTERNINN